MPLIPATDAGLSSGAHVRVMKSSGRFSLQVNRVETYMKTGQAAQYEASFTNNKGKKHEVVVKAEGTETKS
jgi:hypothetical protein